MSDGWTKGPWKVGQPENIGGTMTEDQAKANARLISAAPDMAEALEGLFARIDWENPGEAFEPDAGCLQCTHGTTPDTLNTGPCPYHKGLAALAKARGQS